MTTVVVFEWRLRWTSWWRVMGWMSSGSLSAIKKVKEYWENLCFWRMGFYLKRRYFSGCPSKIRLALKRRSIMSQKGNSPVPPAKTMILPEGVVSSSSPLPMAQLTLKLSTLNYLCFSIEVNLPLGYTFSMMGKKEPF